MKTTFCIQRGLGGRESLAIRSASEWLGAEVVVSEKALPGATPIGSVEFCEPVFGDHFVRFFPDFLRHTFNRPLMRYRGPYRIEGPVFVKDISGWKTPFESRLLPHGESMELPEGDFLLSPQMQFWDEWRYYVACGEVVATGWYKGMNPDTPAPVLHGVEWPKDFSGAADFGSLVDGRVALVECHAPFACGWYGEDHRDYALWQALAWENRNWWLR